jgi:predicted nucleic acid-binding protein
LILVDTSVWVDHLRAGNQTLARLLDAGLALAHPFVIGEVALGNLSRRKLVLDALSDQPRSAVATDAEVLHFIERHALFGRGIGYIDAHLLAAVSLMPGTALWTQDKRLHEIADRLELAAIHL